MNKLIKNKWIKALRSGKYQQGKYYLKGTDNKYCCLGVLCDLFAKTHKAEWIPHGSICLLSTDKKGVMGTLPDEVIKWAKLESNDKTGAAQHRLIPLNDKENYNFNQIADFIEKEF
jgi:hypothetical protein